VRDCPPGVSAFWGAALGYVPGNGNDTMLVSTTGSGPMLLLDEDDRYARGSRAANAQRTGGRGRAAISLGRPTGGLGLSDDADFVVLADTEGNRSAYRPPVAKVTERAGRRRAFDRRQTR